MDQPDYCDRRLAGLESGSIPDIGPRSAIVIWSLTGSATLFLILRICCKISRSNGLWWDDLVLVISWVIFVAASALCQRIIDYGFGRYSCDISPESNLELIAFEGGALASTCMILAIVWSKTSFGITLLRLLRNRLRGFVAVVIVIMNVAMILQALFSWVKCIPVEKSWRPSVEGTCWDARFTSIYGISSGVLSGVCDLLFAFLPWTILWKLQMRTKEKVGVAFAMSMGVAAGATAFVKSYYVSHVGSKEFSYNGAYLITWAAAEISTTIMASCIPFLRVLFRDLGETTPIQQAQGGGHLGKNCRYCHQDMVGQHPALGNTSTTAPDDGIVTNEEVKDSRQFTVPAICVEDTTVPLKDTVAGPTDSVSSDNIKTTQAQKL